MVEAARRVSATRRFEPDTAQVATARHFARTVSYGWGVDPMEIEIVVGELAANAVLHGRTQFTVRLMPKVERIRLEVADDNPRTPWVAAAPINAQSGRGLRVVDALSAAWGIELVPDDGKVVWAELAVQRVAVPA